MKVWHVMVFILMGGIIGSLATLISVKDEIKSGSVAMAGQRYQCGIISKIAK